MSTPHLTPASTLADDLARRGFDHQFVLTEDHVHDVTTNTDYVPEQVEVVEEHRAEGMTNPDDEGVLFALRAPDGAKGTLSASYGPDTSHPDALRRLGSDHR